MQGHVAPWPHFPCPVLAQSHPQVVAYRDTTPPKGLELKLNAHMDMNCNWGPWVDIIYLGGDSCPILWELPH